MFFSLPTHSNSNSNSISGCFKYRGFLFSFLLFSRVFLPSKIAQQANNECEMGADMDALGIQEDCKHSNTDKRMANGRKKFNMDPKKG